MWDKPVEDRNFAMRLGDIAEKLQCELRGDAQFEIRGVAGIEEATSEEMTFVSNPKYLSKIKDTRAGAIVLPPDAPFTKIATLISDHPYLTFARAIQLFYQPPEPIPGIHPTASIADTAALGEGYSIGANVVISEGVRVGNNATLYPNVVLYPYARIGDDFVAHSHAVVREYCRLGNRVTLQNGAVVGADGFGFAPHPRGGYEKIVQSGIVVLEDDVELGAHACVDRASVGETRVEKGTKIDNLVQIGHGSRVGRHTILAAQAGLAGTTRIGNHVTLAGQVGVAGHLKVGDEVIATAQTGIARSVEAGRKISGTPEMDSALWKRNYLIMHHLPEMARSLKALKEKVLQLEEKLQPRKSD
ncbi:MAG: UDP-3-O-(3-hydroxymyristoyl)glucosamine N-acyltransferase [Acidobacteriota bacterium]